LFYSLFVGSLLYALSCNFVHYLVSRTCKLRMVRLLKN
jgi:hypothetical protein